MIGFPFRRISRDEERLQRIQHKKIERKGYAGSKFRWYIKEYELEFGHFYLTCRCSAHRPGLCVFKGIS